MGNLLSLQVVVTKTREQFIEDLDSDDFTA